MFDKKTPKAEALIDSEWTASCVQHLEILLEKFQFWQIIRKFN